MKVSGIPDINIKNMLNRREENMDTEPSTATIDLEELGPHKLNPTSLFHRPRSDN